MKQMKSYCDKCDKLKEVLTLTFDKDGACIHSLKCGHERYLKYPVKNDITRVAT